MSFFVQQEHEEVFSASYQTARVALTTRLEQETAKQLGKALVEKATGNRGGGPQGAAVEE